MKNRKKNIDSDFFWQKKNPEKFCGQTLVNIEGLMLNNVYLQAILWCQIIQLRELKENT